MTRQAQLIAILSDLISVEGEIDPAVHRWAAEHGRDLLVCSPWVLEHIGQEIHWVRRGSRGSPIAVVPQQSHPGARPPWQWLVTTHSGHSAHGYVDTERQARDSADAELTRLGYHLIAGSNS